MSGYTTETERTLRDAGWTPGRSVDTTELRRWLEKSGFVVSEAAERFLSEFVDLKFPYQGSGITRAREKFELDPRLCDGEDDRFTEWSETIGTPLTPIGELDQRWFLGISESGEIFCVECCLGSFGSGRQALENLILGVMPTEIPDEMVE